MKTILLSVVLLTMLSSAAFADGKKSAAQMFTDLKTALKNVNESSWKTSDNFKTTSFKVNGKDVNAYVNNETDDLIGFTMPIDAKDLPENTQENIAKKYQGWKMVNPIMFITNMGKIDYYVQVVKQGRSLALNISPKGKPSVYAQIIK